jgi:small conductance mechanosensitive channel
MQFQDVAKNPAPQVGIQSFGDFSINISFRYWVPTVKYFDTLHGVNLGVFRALQKASIKIPYPQHEVRMIQP